MPSATSNQVLTKGFAVPAATVIVKGRAVKLSGVAEEITPVTAVTDPVIGIAVFDVSSAEQAKGKGATVVVMGEAVMEASAVIDEGNLIAPSANGRAQVAVSTNRVIGIAMEPASGAGKYFKIQLSLPGTILA
jgi:hypothetical protein